MNLTIVYMLTDTRKKIVFVEAMSVTFKGQIQQVQFKLKILYFSQR